MQELEKKNVLVVGRGECGRAVARFVGDRGAFTTQIEREDQLDLSRKFDCAVICPEASSPSVAKKISAAGVPVISDLELGFQHSRCLNIAISGTNGKSSLSHLLSEILRHCERKTRVAGFRAEPICNVVDETKDLDFLTVPASVFQLEHIQYFRPSVAVLLNIHHDHQDEYPSHPEYVRAKAKLFKNQQPFDWAIVQSEAWAQMRSLNLPMPGKVITFSANNRRADIFFDRGLLVSRIEDWAGPLIDLAQTAFHGPHQAENVMAALAIGRVLRLPLEQMVEVIKKCKSLPGRSEFLAEVNGVKFINDSCSANVESLRNAVLSVPAERGGPNIWLIAGGEEKTLDYHDVGPLFSQRVKGVFAFGKSREKLRAAWSLFTPCTLADSLLHAVSQAAENARPGDIVLFSPATSSTHLPESDLPRDEVYRNAVKALGGTSNSAGGAAAHNIQARNPERAITGVIG